MNTFGLRHGRLFTAYLRVAHLEDLIRTRDFGKQKKGSSGTTRKDLDRPFFMLIS